MEPATLTVVVEVAPLLEKFSPEVAAAVKQLNVDTVSASKSCEPSSAVIVTAAAAAAVPAFANGDLGCPVSFVTHDL